MGLTYPDIYGKSKKCIIADIHKPPKYIYDYVNTCIHRQ